MESATTWPDTIMCIAIVIGVCVLFYIFVKHTDVFKD